MQQLNDKPMNQGQEKQPYEMPTLTKLGTVQQLTAGVGGGPNPDMAGMSF